MMHPRLALIAKLIFAAPKAKSAPKISVVRWAVVDTLFRAVIAATLLAGPVTSSAQAEDFKKLSYDQIRQIYQTKIRAVQHAALNPVSLRWVRLQNAEELDRKTILSRDEKWSQSKQLTPFKRSLQRNGAGKFLKRLVDNNPYVLEAFLTDNQGANVAAYPATSDYWQGDEDKWKLAYANGEGSIYLGEIEFDDSLQTDVIQVGAPVMDRGKAIGVLVISIDLNYGEVKMKKAIAEEINQ